MLKIVITIVSVAATIGSFLISIPFYQSCIVGIVCLLAIIWAWWHDCKRENTNFFRALTYKIQKNSQSVVSLEKHAIYEYKAINKIVYTRKEKLKSMVDDCCVVHGRYKWSKGDKCNINTAMAKHEIIKEWQDSFWCNYLIFLGQFHKKETVFDTEITSEVDKTDTALASGTTTPTEKLTLEVRFNKNIKATNPKFSIFTKFNDVSPSVVENLRIEPQQGSKDTVVKKEVIYPMCGAKYELTWAIEE